ncbi:MAG: phenylacetate--CoA ligase family protein [Anaerolineae bacterium]|nr:phenylacetate--CoA ligase family protein [Anaerolineae bacterium]
MATRATDGPLSIAFDAWRVGKASPGSWAPRRQARLTQLIRHARQSSPFYSKLYRSSPEPCIDLRYLPVVTKPDLMAAFDESVTDRAVTRTGVEAFVSDAERVGEPFLGRYLVCTSSGTTGVPGIFLHDPHAVAVYQALVMTRSYVRWFTLSQTWALARRGVRGAMVLAAGGHFAGIGWLERARRLYPRLAGMFRSFSALQPIDELVSQLTDFQPTLLLGYPSALAVLADERAAGRLAIEPMLVASVGESFTEAMRQRIEEGFQSRLRDSYGASEFLYMAFGCDQGWLHLHADWVVLEPVDKQYGPVPPGEPSHTVLLTNLANRVQPIIRYDLGDSVTVKPEPCPCGYPLPAIKVQGRQADVLSFRGAGGRSVPVLPLALATVIEETVGVQRFQAIQTGPAELRLRLLPEADRDAEQVWEAVQGRLRAWLGSQGLENVRLVRAGEPPQQDPVSGKLRQVWADL